MGDPTLGLVKRHSPCVDAVTDKYNSPNQLVLSDEAKVPSHQRPPRARRESEPIENDTRCHYGVGRQGRYGDGGGDSEEDGDDNN